MRCSLYVGRVGALAVALGIGTAVANAPATAWATPADSGPGPSPDSSSQSSGPSAKGTSGPSGPVSRATARPRGGAAAGGPGGAHTSTGIRRDARASVGAEGAPPVSAVEGATPAGNPATQPGRRTGTVAAAGGTTRTPTVNPKPPTSKLGLDGPSARGDAKPRKALTRVPAASTVPLHSDAERSPVSDSGATIPSDPPAPVETLVVLTALGSGRRFSPSAPEMDAGSSLAAVSAVAAAPTVGAPDQVTGAVSGSLNGYAVTGQPAGGSVAVNAQTGTYTYTPTLAARLQAGQTVPADYDSFPVGLTGQPATVITVPVLPAVLANSGNMPAASLMNPTGLAVSGNGAVAYVANQGGNTVSVLNTATGAVSKTVKVGSQPSAVAVSSDAGRAYVANRGGGTVTVINTTTNTVVGSAIRVGSAPQDVAVNAAGTRVYVANNGSNSVSVINTANNGVTTIGLGTGNSAPTAIALNSDGSRAYVTHRNSSGAGVVSVIDTSANTVIATVGVGSAPQDLAVVGTRVYVANTGGSVSVINTAAGSSVSTVNVGGAPTSLAASPDGSLVVVARSDDNVAMIDTKTNTVIGSPLLLDTTAGDGGHIVAFGPDGRSIYITDAVERTVRVVAVRRGNTAPTITSAPAVVAKNTATGAVTGSFTVTDPDYDALTATYSATIPAGTVSVTGTPSDAGAYVFNYMYTPTTTARLQAASTPGEDSTSFVIAIGDGRTVANVTVTALISPAATVGVTPIAVGSHPIDAVVAGDRLYVANSGDGSVSVIDTNTNQVINTITGVGYSAPMAASADGRYLYLSQYDSYNVTASVKVVDTATRSVVATVTMPRCESECWANSAGITDVAISPDDSRVYVSELWVGDSFYAGTVTMFETATNTVVATASNSQYSDFYSNIEVSPDGTRLYAGSGYPYFPQMDVFDAHTLQSAGAARLNGNPGWPPLSIGSLTFSPDGKRAYARTTEIWPTYTSQTFAVIDTDRASATYNTQIATITVPAGAQYLQVSPDGSRAYVVHSGGTTVTIIDTTTNTVIGSISSSQVGGDYAALAVGRNGTLYFTNYATNSVYAVTVEDLTLL